MPRSHPWRGGLRCVDQVFRMMPLDLFQGRCERAHVIGELGGDEIRIDGAQIPTGQSVHGVVTAKPNPPRTAMQNPPATAMPCSSS
jgi:hypothetical protein